MLEKKCYFCGNDSDNIFNTVGGAFIVCENCIDNLQRCKICDRVLSPAKRIEKDFPCECDACKKRVQSYSYSHNYNYIPSKIEDEPSDTTLYGSELEITKGSLWEEDEELLKIRDTYPNIICNDGSICGNGFEIISMPMSLRKWKSQELKIKHLFDYLISKGYTSHDNGSCGLHIHATRPSDEVIDRIIFIMEFYKEELKKFARRGGNSYNCWYSEYNTSNIEKLKCLSEVKDVWNSNRYMVLNTRNEKTIEFRLFRGTLNFETYFATLELVDNIMRLCGDLKKPVSQITWKALTGTPFAKKYCKEKNIECDKRPIDYTKKMLRAKVTFIKDKNRILNLLFDEHNKAVDEYNGIKIDKMPKMKVSQNNNVEFTNIQSKVRTSQAKKDVSYLKLKSLQTIINEFANSINYNSAKRVLNMRNLSLPNGVGEKISEIIAKGVF